MIFYKVNMKKNKPEEQFEEYNQAKCFRVLLCALP